MTNHCTLYLVRHGQTEWNAAGMILGQRDSPLTAKGIAQARQLEETFQRIHFDAIYSSDLLRAQRTAEIIVKERQLAIQTSQLLRERNYGHWSDKSAAEYRAGTQHLLEIYQQLPDSEKWRFKFGDDMESDEEVVTRFITVLREIAVAYPGKSVLVVTHGGCIRTFLMRLGVAKPGELPRGAFSNGGYVKVLSDGVDFILEDIVGLDNLSQNNFQKNKGRTSDSYH